MSMLAKTNPAITPIISGMENCWRIVMWWERSSAKSYLYRGRCRFPLSPPEGRCIKDYITESPARI